ASTNVSQLSDFGLGGSTATYTSIALLYTTNETADTPSKSKYAFYQTMASGRTNNISKAHQQQLYQQKRVLALQRHQQQQYHHQQQLQHQQHPLNTPN
ncbi:unnamed protein product, partial [Ceratitis capitata]